MFLLTIPGKAGALSIQHDTASAALKTFHDITADGLAHPQIRNEKGDKVSVAELEALVRVAASIEPIRAANLDPTP